MYEGGYIKTGATGIAGGYTAGPGAMTEVDPLDEWRAYFFTNDAGKWMYNERAQQEYARIYGEDALADVLDFGVVAENISPVAVGGTLIGGKTVQREVYDINTGDVAVEVNEDVGGRGAQTATPVGPPTPAPDTKVVVPTAGPTPVVTKTGPATDAEDAVTAGPSGPSTAMPTEIPWTLVALAAGAFLLLRK